MATKFGVKFLVIDMLAGCVAGLGMSLIFGLWYDNRHWS